MHPSVAVHGNDVSLLTCALGRLARGESFALRFKGRLGFIEELLALEDFAGRVAAVTVGLEIAKYKTSNAFTQAHFAHYREIFQYP